MQAVEAVTRQPAIHSAAGCSTMLRAGAGAAAAGDPSGAAAPVLRAVEGSALQKSSTPSTTAPEQRAGSGQGCATTTPPPCMGSRQTVGQAEHGGNWQMGKGGKGLTGGNQSGARVTGPVHT